MFFRLIGIFTIKVNQASSLLFQLNYPPFDLLFIQDISQTPLGSTNFVRNDKNLAVKLLEKRVYLRLGLYPFEGPFPIDLDVLFDDGEHLYQLEHLFLKLFKRKGDFIVDVPLVPVLARGQLGLESRSFYRLAQSFVRWCSLLLKIAIDVL
jgi:hypothetical protein